MASRLLLVAAGFLISVLLVEVLAGLYLGIARPHVEPIIRDARLVHRPNPEYPGHDARGWRNVVALKHADVVVLGDSQTYGINAAIAETWPQRLAVYLRHSVYQMAYGGYGPAHYVPLLGEALTLRPKILLVAYYFGNDLYDGYSLVYKSGVLIREPPDLALGSLATSDPEIREAMTGGQGQDQMVLRYEYLDCSRPPVSGVNPLRFLDVSTRGDGVAVKQPTPPPARRRISTFLNRSAAFRIVWPHLRPRLKFMRDPPEDYGPPLCVHYRAGRIRTVFNIGYRLLSLDESDPRIVEGARVNLRALKYLAESSRRAGVHFYTVLIPTKETAFRVHAEPALQNEPYLRKLWNAEMRARNLSITFLNREGIKMIDALPALEALIASGVNPYREGADGHPIAAGYEAIALAVADRLERDGLSRP